MQQDKGDLPPYFQNEESAEYLYTRGYFEGQWDIQNDVRTLC